MDGEDSELMVLTEGHVFVLALLNLLIVAAIEYISSMHIMFRWHADDWSTYTAVVSKPERSAV